MIGRGTYQKLTFEDTLIVREEVAPLIAYRFLRTCRDEIEFEEIRWREIGAKRVMEEFTDQTVWMGIKKVIDNINANAVA